MVSYFWDSYAVIEFIDGNKNYVRFIGEEAVITIFNLAEIYWFAIHEYDEEKADSIYAKFKNCVIDMDDQALKDAIKFRKLHKSKNLSYTDCIGYTLAKKNNLKFLTGDKEFEGMNNVEFVK
ncbi:PIN domain-containing protein [Candidatus Woesearchaeota archaeon]|nr:PIN domain-containing protein [Candidatus Woesearchaeota archaeon]